MPLVAEFTTDGHSRILDSGHAPDEDKDAIENFEKQAIAMAEARRRPVPAGVAQWSRRAFQELCYGDADTREF